MDRHVERTDDAHISRVKRTFLLNLALFLCLLAFGIRIYIGQESAATTDKEPPVFVPPKEHSLEELAYLRGQIAALKTHPATVPKLEPGWVRKLSKQELHRDSYFSHTSTAQFEELISEFIKGFTERFDDYYDIQPAYKFGYNYGIRHTPENFHHIPPTTIGQLRKHRERLEEKFALQGEAEWLLFCEAFDKGFLESFHLTEDDYRPQSHSRFVELFED